MNLVEPSLEYLPGYVDALERGWTPDEMRGEPAGRAELADIARDPRRFIAEQVDREARGRPIVLPDGSQARRLPGYRLWIWDESFCGSIGLRWQRGRRNLPAHVLGHIGYAVVPWKRGRGYAKRALGLMRERVRAEGLVCADLVADLDNLVSQKVILANGGFPLERFREPESYGGREALRFRWYTGSPLPIERETARLRLRQWSEADRAPFATMNGDPRVMEHFPALLSREESDALAVRSSAAIALRGWGLWALERKADRSFLGFVGLTLVRDALAFAPAIEIGWRLAPAGWGQGYATEAARAALEVAFDTLDLPEVVSYTAGTNERSLAVMRRLAMREDTPFDHPALPEGHRLRRHRLFRLRR